MAFVEIFVSELHSVHTFVFFLPQSVSFKKENQLIHSLLYINNR